MFLYEDLPESTEVFEKQQTNILFFKETMRINHKDLCNQEDIYPASLCFADIIISQSRYLERVQDTESVSFEIQVFNKVKNHE